MGKYVFGLFALLLASSAHAQLVIAHRGASAYLPEHTLEAYALAYGMGADYLEPDVVLTRDGELICAHDLTMERVTDVATRFPDRARDDGSWYWIDFDLAEIKALSKRGTRSAADDDPGAGQGYQVATLREMLTLVQRLNESLGAHAGRTVGVIPEPKSPGFHAAAGQPIEAKLLGMLEMYGYTGSDDHAIVQCFELASLVRFADLGAGGTSGLRLVWLLGQEPSLGELLAAKLFCVGLGPSRPLLEDGDGAATPFLFKVQELGFELYPYTFKGTFEQVQQDVQRFFTQHRVEGVFTDNPDAGVAARP